MQSGTNSRQTYAQEQLRLIFEQHGQQVYAQLAAQTNDTQVARTLLRNVFGEVYEAYNIGAQYDAIPVWLNYLVIAHVDRWRASRGLGAAQDSAGRPVQAYDPAQQQAAAAWQPPAQQSFVQPPVQQAQQPVQQSQQPVQQAQQVWQQAPAQQPYWQQPQQQPAAEAWQQPQADWQAQAPRTPQPYSPPQPTQQYAPQNFGYPGPNVTPTQGRAIRTPQPYSPQSDATQSIPFAPVVAPVSDKAKTEPEKKSKKKQNDPDKKPKPIAQILSVSGLVLCMLILLWGILGLMMGMDILPQADLGYEWFNKNVFSFF